MVHDCTHNSYLKSFSKQILEEQLHSGESNAVVSDQILEY
jgi:hypothetical protein